MVAGVIARYGHIDILVNNAGSRHGPDLVPVVDLPEEAWDETMRVNLKGTFLCSKAVAREMIRRDAGGKIIVMSSAVGERGQANRAAYCASKFALVGFAGRFALELAPHRINVNALCPGMADTERMDCMAEALTPHGQTAAQHRAAIMRDRTAAIPLGRIAESEDIAPRVAAFLASRNIRLSHRPLDQRRRRRGDGLTGTSPRMRRKSGWPARPAPPSSAPAAS